MLWATVALRRHAVLETGAFDLGIFANGLWNWIHGYGYISAPKDGMHLLADHASPIVFVFAPFLALLPTPETLLVSQSLALAFGALPLLALGRQYGLRNWRLAALPLLYWGNLAIREANAFDFHPEVLVLPVGLTALWLCQEKDKTLRWFGVAGLIAVALCKESAAATLAGIGLAWFLGAGPTATRARTRKLGLVLLVLGPALFVFDLTVWPKFFGGAYGYAQGYPTSLLEGVRRILGYERWHFAFWLLAPLAFLPLAGGPALWAALPSVLMIFLSPGDHRVNIHYHYGVEPTLGLLWATSVALGSGFRFRGKKEKQFLAAIAICALVFHARPELLRLAKLSPTPQARRARLAAHCVAPDAAISANDGLVAQLAMRQWAHGLNSFRRPGGGVVDCVLLDPTLRVWPLTGPELEALPGALAQAGFARGQVEGSLQIWESRAFRGRCWTCGAPGAAGDPLQPDCTSKSDAGVNDSRFVGACPAR